MTGPAVIYKLAPRALWEAAEASGSFEGASVDLADGYIHFSTADQVAETARRHFSTERDILLIAVDLQALGDALRLEPSRGGALFPHLYKPLPLTAVRSVTALPDDADERERLLGALR